MQLQVFILSMPMLCSALPSLYPAPAQESVGSSYWLDQGQREIRRVEHETIRSLLKSRAKHVVLFIGDGMGVSTVTAARILKGQLENSSGDEAQLSFERFQHTALAKTYNTDYQTADSAGTATAFLTGVKTRSGLLGVNGNAIRGNCSSLTDETRLTSFLRMAADEGRAVGIVSTTRLTHATPAAAYSHSVDRGWESDSSSTSDDRSRCPDIARQMLLNAADYKVILGGGRQNFLPEELKGKRKDGANLIREWQAKQGSLNCSRRAYIETRNQLLDLEPDKVDCVLGLLSSSHMEYHAENMMKQNLSERQPSLAEMTTKALELLTVYGKDTGLVLLVEAGRIDHGHHGNQANRALHETVALSDAVEAAVQLLKQKKLLDETLMIVTADHSHVFTMGHYGLRGQPITQLKYKRNATTGRLQLYKAGDDLPLTVLNYADGRGASKSRHDRWSINATAEDTTKADYQFPAMMLKSGESHGGEDVPVFARGPGSHLVQGVREQTHVAHVIMYSAHLGPYASSQRESFQPTVAPNIKSAIFVNAAYIFKLVSGFVGFV
ncbi:hypothetical protein BOX15_Mlig021345g1 [Macrostomum lignano]|uniref:alkaline phosphatase n=1 Tax=Macrostomum lignano TaxID=282301 RepID=A0A267F4N3_9PLAT|nr:hypothetical protein BOX15_Mlig021345g1 [Macrostomum lignano]